MTLKFIGKISLFVVFRCRVYSKFCYAGILNLTSLSELALYITLAFSFAIEQRIDVTLCFIHP